MKFKSIPLKTDDELVKRKTWNVRWPERLSPGEKTTPTLPTIVRINDATSQLRRKPQTPENGFCQRPVQNRVEHWRSSRMQTRFVRVSSSHGLSAALASIFICVALLTYMISLFARKLKTVESEVLSRKGVLDGSISAHSLYHSSFYLPTGQYSTSRRRLASTEPLSTKDRSGESNYVSLIHKLRRSISSIRRLQSFLNNPNRALITTDVFDILIAYRNRIHTLSDAAPKAVSGSPATFVPNYDERNERLRSVPKSTPPLVLHNVGKHLLPQVTSHAPPIRSSVRENRPRAPNLIHENGNVLYRNALNVVGDLVPVAPPLSTAITMNNRKDGSITPTPKLQVEKNKSNGIAHHAASKGTREEGTRSGIIREQRKASFLPGMIEIWILKSGGSLCRIYDIARLSDGKLILPKWMTKHESVLQHYCGLKDIIFAIKSAGTENQLMFGRDALNGTVGIRVLDRTNLDLFSLNAPRHHMPHFVTDILFPLTASEILQGSGSAIAKLAIVRPASPANSLETATKAFQDIKPSLFLRRETWQAKPSEWVQRLANFFSHPAVGYALLSEKEGQRKLSSTKKKTTPIWRFRSVLSSSKNIYENNGLFDPNGNNIVLSRNGLSGTPAWNIKGISQNPCRVVVTALTRRGPRALLHLDALKKTAAGLFKSSGLVLDFRVVRFENTSFEAQVKIMQGTNVLIATHGAGNANIIFMRHGATVIEVFPFAYRAGPFETMARTFGLEYKTAMSAPQTSVFKECMNQNESKEGIKRKVFDWWDNAVAQEKVSPWVHRLELEKEFGEPGKSEGMATRRCVRMQQLAFDTETVAAMAFQSAKQQCSHKQVRYNTRYRRGR